MRRIAPMDVAALALPALGLVVSLYVTCHPDEYGEMTGLAILAVVLALTYAMSIFRAIRSRRRAAAASRTVQGELEAVADWATENDWVVEPLGYPGLDDDIDRVTALTGNAGWGTSGARDQYGRDNASWAFGGAVSRDTASGRLIVVAGFRYRNRRLWASLATTATAPDVTLDLVDDDRIEQTGKLPELEPGESPAELLARFEPLARLRILAGEILLCTPGRVEPERLASIADQLASLERRLPRRPGAGPQR